MKSLKRGQHISQGGHTGAAAQASRRALEAHAATRSLIDMCNSQRKVKVAFVTPYPPRSDGLALYAANLRASLLAECANLQVCVLVGASCVQSCNVPCLKTWQEWPAVDHFACLCCAGGYLRNSVGLLEH
jgi:hypothetical protein